MEEFAAELRWAVRAGRLSEREAAQRIGHALLDDRTTYEATDSGEIIRVPAELLAVGPLPEAVVVGDSDVDAVIRHLPILGDPVRWDPAPSYRSPALSTVDSVWSIGVRYTGVLNVVDRYRGIRAGHHANGDEDTPADLVAAITAAGGPGPFAEAVKNRQRTSSTNGILKADAVLQCAELLVAAGVSSRGDVQAMSAQELEALRNQWLAVRGQGSGLSWDYFLMLNGIAGVKADRMVRRFVADALGQDEATVSQARAREAVVEAARRVGLDLRDLDYAIWRHRSGQQAG